MNFSIGFNSDKGLKRTKNEDSYAVLNRTELSGKLDGLLVVADGMGGLRGGEIASSTVVQTIPQAILEMLAQRNGSGAPLDAGTMLRDTIIRANGIIWRMRRFENSAETKGMGTTCVAAILHNGTLTVANVGDSRAYLLRDGNLTLLTEDHSEVFEQVQAGRMTMDEASKSQFRNVVTRGIGLGQEVRPDITTHPIQEGDTILLCSDGLTTEVPDAQIAALLSQDEDAQAACDRLVAAALRHGGRDNVTVVAMRYGTFVPSPRALPLTDWDEEPDTDPHQDWRKRPPRPLLDNEDEEEEEYEEDVRPPVRAQQEPRMVRRRPPLFSTPALVVIMLLLLIGLAEGALLYNAMRVAKATEKSSLPKPPEAKPTDGPLNYSGVTTLGQRTLQDDFLQVDPRGNALVVTVNGNMMRITPQGEEVPLPGSFPSLPDKSAAPPVKMVSRPDVALDISGNVYVISTEDKSILIFNPEGVRTNSGLARGELTAPTRIIVDNQTGSLYILDNHRLKRITATRPPGQATSSAPAASGKLR